jgi:lipoprotein-releasing system ATP-binding protein
MLSLRNVRHAYDGAEVLNVAEWQAEQGSHWLILGLSGSGKTTLLHILAGILRPDRGEVEVVGQRLDRLGEAARDRHRGRHIGMVYQTFNLLQPFTALENVLLGALFGRGAGGDAKARAEALLAQVGLGDRLHHRPAQLSVGQVQRVAICRALVNEPELILMDEPLGNQDRATGGQVLDLLLRLARDGGKTVVMVTHDPESATRMQRTVDLATLRPAAVAAAGGGA